MSAVAIEFEALAPLLESRKGAYPLTIRSYTLVKMNKFIDDVPNPYYNRVYKRACVNGMANWVYANSVNLQRSREGKDADFVPHRRQWGVRLENSPLVYNKNKNEYYLELKVEKSIWHQYYLDGVEISDEEVNPYLPLKSQTRQGVDKEIILRDYMLRNIETVCMNGINYEITKTNIAVAA